MLIAFASDYGLADEFAGVCKAVMLGIAPDAEIVDLSHDIPRHDVRAGALLLVRTVQYLPTDTIVVGVVDPGVGTDRRLVGIAVDGGVLVGPDNGLLAPAVAMAGGAQRVVSLAGPYTLPSPGPTFAGRDVLAPAAGHLAAGVLLDELGEAVDPVGLVPGMVSLPETLAGGAVARRSVVGGPVRELPAQRRSRRARAVRGPGRRSRRAASRLRRRHRDHPGGALGANLRGRRSLRAPVAR